MAVLERVVAVLLPVAYADERRVHEQVVGVGHFYPADVYVLAVPEGLLRVGYLDILEGEALDLAKHLWGLDAGVLHDALLGVPDGGTGAGGEHRVGDVEAHGVPEGILALESATLRPDVRAALQSRLTGMKRHVVKSQMMLGKEWTLSAEFLVLYYGHISVYWKGFLYFPANCLAKRPKNLTSSMKYLLNMRRGSLRKR